MLTILESVPTDPTTPEAQQNLLTILRCRFADLLAQAARLVGKHELTSLTPDLVNAFERGLEKPDTDPNCLAKCAIAETLYRFTYSDEALFLQGIRHVQMEPVWGGQVDTAPELRGLCALGLVRMNYPDVLVELADLLADPEPPARIAAARAIAYSENPQGIPLLRLRARVGDRPEVLAECLAALLNLDPSGSLSFVVPFLDHPETQVQELVALALGESRLASVFDDLQQWWQRTRIAELRSIGLLAIATLRSDPAFEFLLSLVTTGSLKDAKDAVEALSIYRRDDHLWNRVCQIIEERDAAPLKALIRGLEMDR